jgi:murein DD-endopeptidase MepM/ murein hydrolase activator NlpD
VLTGEAELSFENSFSYPRGEQTHDAIDIFGPIGTPIVSSVIGRVVETCVLGGETRAGAGYKSPGGYYLVLVDLLRNFHYYAHMQGPPKAAPGGWVGPGTILGALGESGIVRGWPHLHYQVWGPFTDESAEEEYEQNNFPRCFGEPINPYWLLVRLADGLGASHNLRGRYTIPARR